MFLCHGNNIFPQRIGKICYHSVFSVGFLATKNGTYFFSFNLEIPFSLILTIGDNNILLNSVTPVQEISKHDFKSMKLASRTSR